MVRENSFTKLKNCVEFPNLDILDEDLYKESFRAYPAYNSYNNRMRSEGKGALLTVYENKQIS
jgi:hypothetical protein